MNKTKLEKSINAFDLIILISSFVTLSFWFSGKGLLYTQYGPVLSPFTSLSLLLMSGSRLALKNLVAFPIPLTMACLGLVIGGNLSSIMVQLINASLLLDALPSLVPTSIMTSIGLILFCSYELLVILRKTPESAFIIDDILLHLALLPGGISLLGHMQNNSYYISSDVDPRCGISILEMAFMGSYAVVAALSNQRLFLWSFLKKNLSNRLIFAGLFINQYIAPLVVSWIITGGRQVQGLGIEIFVMLAGVMATLTFLVINATRRRETLET